MDEQKKGLTYADAGVDIDAGNKAVELMKDSVRASYRPEVIGDLGGFGGLFALNTKKYKEPVLVSGTDGVGTKLKLAFQMNRHDTIGQDAVAMCVNDILVQGAEPLFSWTISPWTRSIPRRWRTLSKVSPGPAGNRAAPSLAAKRRKCTGSTRKTNMTLPAFASAPSRRAR